MAKSNNVPRVVFVILLIVAVAFLYVWQRIQIFRIGYKIREHDKRILVLREENSRLQLKISGLTSPREIKKKVEEMELDLVPPKEKQIVRVK